MIAGVQSYSRVEELNARPADSPAPAASGTGNIAADLMPCRRKVPRSTGLSSSSSRVKKADSPVSSVASGKGSQLRLRLRAQAVRIPVPAVRDLARLAPGRLPQHRLIELQRLADPAQAVPDGLVDAIRLDGREVWLPGRRSWSEPPGGSWWQWTAGHRHAGRWWQRGRVRRGMASVVRRRIHH